MNEGLAAVNTGFDDMEVRRRQGLLDKRQERIDALHEPILQAQGGMAALNLEDARRKSGRLRAYDEARMQNESDMGTTTVPDTETLPNPDFQAATPARVDSSIDYFGERNENVPAQPATGLSTMDRTIARPMTEPEKNKRRLDLALKYSEPEDITRIGQLIDVTEKIGVQGSGALLKWATSVEAFRKQFGPQASKEYAMRLAERMGVPRQQVEGIDFMVNGDIFNMAPNGNYYIIKTDGTLYEFKPNTDDKAHNTIDEHSPDGTMVRKMQYNPATRKYDIPATGWSKVQKQVASISINQPEMTPEDIDHYAEMYNKYGRTALPFSLRNMPPKLAARAAELARGAGKTGTDVGLDIAKTGADKLSLNTITKGMDLVNSFEKGVDESLTLVDKLSDKFTRTPIPGINKMTQWMQYNAGDPDVKAFRNALQTAMTEYMKVTTAGMGISVQELTQGAQARAANLHEISDNPQTFKNAFKIMRQEMDIKKRAMAAQRAEIEARMKGDGSKDTPPPTTDTVVEYVRDPVTKKLVPKGK
jgi:hypothetical protein